MIITLEQAIEIAKEDYDIGILSAMEKLNSFGVETPIYDEFIKNADILGDIYFDEKNIEYRDLQFKELGILDLMIQAYEIAWGY